MKKLVLFALLLAAFCGSASVATASDPNQLIGRWIERFPNGNGMVAEFTATTISTYGVDATGKRTIPPTTMKVTYKDLGSSIAVNFVGGGGIMVLVKGPRNIVLDFPGVGAHQLTRIEQ
ncbi:MAG TPA: hypothetical protein VMU87_02915 [Stellaceae bacterium]|nr:hypothetical protein [Stellaceae bacterium]